MTTTGEHAESAYLLGHSPTELDRLVLQARLYDPITTHALRLAGLSSGMRVPDVGCGAGDVTSAAAAIVGPTGAVTGIDEAPAALESARARAARRGAETGGEGEGVISFREAILPDVTLEEPVDAVIGRPILGHLPDPVTALRRLSRPVRPGGIIAFQDFDNHPLRVVPATPLTGAVLQTIAEGLTVDGTGLGAGARLHSLFQEAGLPPSGISATTPTGGAEGRRHELLARTHAFGDRRGPVPVGVEEGRVVCGVVGDEAKGASW